MPSYWIAHPDETAFISALSPEGVGHSLMTAEGWPVGRYLLRVHWHGISPTVPDDRPWGYAVKDGTEVRAQADPNAPVIEKLGLNLVRVMPDQADQGANPPPFLHIATPSGKSGYVPVDALAPLGGDEMCYIKDAAGWKITGYFGGATQ